MKKIIYIIGCVIGGILVGFFAGKLNTILGTVMFTIGVCLLTFSAYKASKEK